MDKEISIEILGERENPLLNRKEVRFNVLYEGAVPSIKDVRTKLLSVLNSNEKLTILDGIKPEFGRSVAKGYAKIYLDEKSMKVEPVHIVKKNFEEKKKGEKPVEGAKAPEAKEEAKAPEAKEEAKAPETKGEKKPKEEVKEEAKPEKKHEGEKEEKKHKEEAKEEKVHEKKHKEEATTEKSK